MKTDNKNILLLSGAMFILAELEENHKWCKTDTTHAIAVNKNVEDDLHYTVVCKDCGEIIIDIPLQGEEEALDELVYDVRDMLEQIDLTGQHNKKLTEEMEDKRNRAAAKELVDKIKEEGFEDDFKDFLENIFNQL